MEQKTKQKRYVAGLLNALLVARRLLLLEYKFVQLGLLSAIPALKAESVSDPSGPQTILPPPPILMTSRMITR